MLNSTNRMILINMIADILNYSQVHRDIGYFHFSLNYFICTTARRTRAITIIEWYFRFSNNNQQSSSSSCSFLITTSPLMIFTQGWNWKWNVKVGGGSVWLNWYNSLNYRSVIEKIQCWLQDGDDDDADRHWDDEGVRGEEGGLLLLLHTNGFGQEIVSLSYLVI